MERERMAREKEEAAMAASMQNRQKKLLNDLAEEEAKREDAVRSLQQMKDKEKEGLITSLSNGTYYIVLLKVEEQLLRLLLSLLLFSDNFDLN